VLGTDGTDIQYFERLGKKYVVCFYPNDAAPYTDERVGIVDVTTPAAAAPAWTSSSIGGTANLNGTGGVDYMPVANNNFLIFILGTNNGVAAFTNSLSVVAVEPGGVEIPQRFSLDQNYPNPFNPSTAIGFAIPERSRVSLKVFDILGRQVADLVNEDRAPGRYVVRWNAQGLASGTYFYRLQAGSYTEMKKLLLLK
jgi:hypothetical protein